VAAEPPQRATPSWVRIVAQGADGRAETLLDRTLDPAARPADRGWVDLQMPLDAVRTALGPDLRFIFESGSDEGSLRPGLPVWWADPTIFEPRAEPHEAVPRNVVLVSIDTLRPDRLGFYGAVRPTSAVLDRLAADGTVFDVAVAQAPWTLPSHATMLTGLYGCVHGTVERQLPRNDLRAFPHRRAQPGRRQHARGGAQPADACDHRRHDDRQRSAALRRLPDLCATLNPTGRRWTGRGVP
jgi:hypothetical protein